MNTALGIVIVNWNGARDTIDCVASIIAADDSSRATVVVVDNNSADNTQALLHEWLISRSFRYAECSLSRFDVIGPNVSVSSVTHYSSFDDLPDVYFVSNSLNSGFAAANNVGARICFAESCSHVWFLNNDTVLMTSAIAEFVGYLSTHSGTGMVGTTLLYYDTKLVQAYGGVEYSFWTGRGHHLGEGENHIDRRLSEEQVVSRIGYISGASMCVSRDFYFNVGPMSEDYFLYNEEADWCWRGRGKYKIGVALNVVVLHKEGASIGTDGVNKGRSASLLSDFFQARNKIIFAKRHFPLSVASVCFFVFLRALRRLADRRYKNFWLLMQVLFGRREPDPLWFRKKG